LPVLPGHRTEVHFNLFQAWSQNRGQKNAMGKQLQFFFAMFSISKVNEWGDIGQNWLRS
jgi:hypothetical protein